MPELINETEGPFTGTWRWNGASYNASWSNGATAVIRVVSFTPTSVTFNRQDSSGATVGLMAAYNGAVTSAADRNGSVVTNGTVTWTWPGHAGYPKSGAWSGNWR
jgi:hypothetical protein